MAEKFYAVKIGLKRGIYTSWEECKALVHGYPGAVYKSFKNIEEAKTFIGDDCSLDITDSVEDKLITEPDNCTEDAFAFVDGSFNPLTNVYGYGGFLVNNGEKYVITGSGDEEEMATMRNVAGEVLGSMAAISKAIEIGLCSITIYYDYMGIEMWATGAWKRNKKGTIAYYEYIKSVEDKIKIKFVKVKGHSGIEGNEEADRLAKKAVGIE